MKTDSKDVDRLKQIDLEFRSGVEAYHIPRWSELPDFELYMDQILGFLEKHTELFGTSEKEKIITNSMINNYVKLGLIKAPVKKKYNKSNIANLIMITILKKVLSMNEIKEAVVHCNQQMGEAESYDLFCHELEKSMIEGLKEMDESVPVFRAATKALSSKVMAEKIIERQNRI